MNITSHKFFKKNLLTLILLIGCNNLFAEEKENTKNPIGCRDAGYVFNLKTLKLMPSEVGALQSLYVVFNKSNQAINLFQMRRDDSSRSMYLNHLINGRQWAILSTNEPSVNYICSLTEENSPYGSVVDCQDHLQVCEYTTVKYGLNNQGSYWLVNSSSKNEAVRAIVRYGIIPAKGS